MITKYPYKNINDTLRKLKQQVIDGLPFALNECPKFETPEQIFYWLKRRTRYKNDPRGIELLQTLPTLLTNNWHGVNGTGDCDCFTISALTLLTANGFKNLYVVLVGRSSKIPVHIYCGYIDKFDGTFKVFDLTNNNFDVERNYPFKQHLKFNI